MDFLDIGYLAVGRTTMYDLVARGDLPTVKIRRCTRFRVEDLDAYISSRVVKGHPKSASGDPQTELEDRHRHIATIYLGTGLDVVS